MSRGLAGYRPAAGWAVLFGLILIAGGTDRIRAAEPGDLAGQVSDGSGGAVAEAQVWVIGGSWEEPRTVAETITDARGRFTLPGFWRDEARLRPGFLSLFARDRGGRLGWQTTLRGNGSSGIDLALMEVGEAQGRVVDHLGKPIVDAEVAPVLFIRVQGKQPGTDYIRLSPEIAGSYAVKTGQAGAFVLRGVPRGTKIAATVSAPGCGTPRFHWGAAEPVTIVVDGRPGRIRGRIVPPDERGAKGAISLSLRRASGSDEPQGGKPDWSYLKTIPIGDDGTFRFDELPPGRYKIDPWFGPDAPFHAEPLADIDVGPNAEVAGLEIPLRRLLTIKGRVVDAEDGRGIANVQIRAYLLERRQHLQHQSQASTDPEGRYRVHVRPGMVLIQPAATAIDHLALDTDACPQIEAKADQEWPDLKLPRAVSITGNAVDGDGKPVEGVEVFVVAPGMHRGDAFNASLQGGPDGSFRIEQVDPKDTLPVRARTKEAATDGPVVIRPKDLKGRLTVTVGSERAFRVRGVVKDRGGRPIAGAKVLLWWNRRYHTENARYATMGLGSVLETHATDASGRFLSNALWPGDRYHVAIGAEGYNAAESPQVEGRAGETHDFGTIALIGAGGHLAGRVVDSAGEPVPVVTVFNRGDGPEPVTVQTDAEGRFRLDGLFAGGKYAFARKEGYRFTAARSETDADHLTIRLLRVDEPPPAWKPGESTTYEAQCALARKLLTRLWDRYGKQANQTGAFVCLRIMALIDPALALRWSEENGGRNDAWIRRIAARDVAETDAAAALELLAGDGNQYVLQELAERYAETDPKKAMAFAEEAAVQSRALVQPDRAGALAEAGAVIARLGRVEAGKKLIDEAAAAAAKMGIAGRQDYARGRVAGALAPFDLERALALIEPIKERNDRERYTAFIAGAIAATDPARALALADAMEGNSSTPQTVKTEVAYRIGPDRPDEAVRIVEGMNGHGAKKYQAEAFGWLAVALAPRDPARSRALIDRALAMPPTHPEEFASYTYFGAGTASAAWIAACARQAGYPDMDSVIARVLAARPAGHLRDPSMEIESLAIAAEVLAATDPGAARQVLRDIEVRSGLGATELSKVARNRWLSAWALADPEHAEQLFDAELAALGGRADVKLQDTGLLKMAEILAVPPRRRLDYLRDAIGATWHPGLQD